MKRSLVAVLLVILCVAACVSSASAEVLLNETFDSAAVGTTLSDLGWTKSFDWGNDVVVTDTVIDSGNSATVTGAWNWIQYNKDFSSRILAAGETAVLSWTAQIAGNDYFVMIGRIRSNDINYDYTNDNGQYIERVEYYGQNVYTTTDRFAKYKIEITNSDTKFYRDNGAGWVYKWGIDAGATNAGAVYIQALDTVLYDNIKYEILTPVPEPGSLLALGTGLVGLTGFVIRRRK